MMNRSVKSTTYFEAYMDGILFCYSGSVIGNITPLSLRDISPGRGENVATNISLAEQDILLVVFMRWGGSFENHSLGSNRIGRDV